MAYILSHRLKVPLICIRKRGVGTHYHKALEGHVTTKRYLIVDDFISSGSTVDSIRKFIRAENPQAKCVALLMYTRREDLGDDYEGIPVYSSRPKDQC